MEQRTEFTLSICIATFNRANYIGQALESIICQVTGECEIVVSDNASTDNTEQVVQEYSKRFDQLRYVRQSTNTGCDRNFDCAVEQARGDYCWLFSDDDVMKPGAIEAVIRALRSGYSLVLVNGEHRDISMSIVRVPSFFGIDSDRVYSTADFDRLFDDVGTCVMCVCCVVIKRALWLARERKRYYSSWFLHTAVVFQERIPGNTLVMAKPLMSLRLGNKQTAESQSFNVWFISWPSLIWSFPLSEDTKKRFSGPKPWRRFSYLIALRATGLYGQADYKQWLRPRLNRLRDTIMPVLVAHLPRKVAYGLYGLYSSGNGLPSCPYAAFETMFPKSLRILRPQSARS